jgi:translation initiation factor IF-1
LVKGRRKVRQFKVLKGEVGDNGCLLNTDDLVTQDFREGEEIEILAPNRGLIILATTDKGVKPGSIVISKKNIDRLRITEGDVVYISPKEEERRVGEEYVPPP